MSFDYDAVKDVLTCPQSHTPLGLDGESLICTDETCRLKFEIRDGIPILLLDEAAQLSVADWEAALQRAKKD